MKTLSFFKEFFYCDFLLSLKKCTQGGDFSLYHSDYLVLFLLYREDQVGSNTNWSAYLSHISKNVLIWMNSSNLITLNIEYRNNDKINPYKFKNISTDIIKFVFIRISQLWEKCEPYDAQVQRIQEGSRGAC